MDDETREALKRNFDTSGNLASTWLWVAGNLRQAVCILEPHFVADFQKATSYEQSVVGARILGPVLMLRGCELECLLKALYVASGKKLAKDGKYVAPRGRPHDLMALAVAAGLTPSAQDSAMLSYLGYFITNGRYPIPTKAPEAFHLRADGTARDRVWGTEEEVEYQEFRQRLRRRAEEAGRAWDEQQQWGRRTSGIWTPPVK